MKKNLGEVVFYKNVLHNFMLRLKKKIVRENFTKFTRTKTQNKNKKIGIGFILKNNVTSIRDIF